MFLVNGVVSLPYLMTETKMQFERLADLLDVLSLWEDNVKRKG